MNAQTPPRPVAVITGASSGIGAVYADRFAARGHDLVLVARRGDRLAELGNRLWARYGVAVRPLVADLSTEPGIAAVEALLESDAGVTVLVNNAGLSRLGRFIDLSPADHASLLMVNAVAPSRLARAALPGFVARDSGTIINIASANAVSPYPGTTVYSATKSFVLSLSLGLQNEVEGTGVRVQAVVPASTATEVWDGMGIDLKDLPPE
ncbi:SDR family NAD(P)-dependent oxidoreductase, partial [Tabrizicola sp.]|uniref:SDR family NAD(P)-dependent oxidoreductase n=1 Tax=Tabrizicola sp. TaxID=2005166 RepID=UPI003F3947A5